jgi:tetratricopeptide (TPR) repeat protein
MRRTCQRCPGNLPRADAVIAAGPENAVAELAAEKMLRKLLIWALMLVPVSATAAAAGDDLYQRLFDRGMADFAIGEFGGAFHELRSAAFGFVEQIDKFETAEAYAAIASHRLGHDADTRDVLLRIVAAETIDPHFRSVKLPAALRTEIESSAALLLTRKEAATLGVSAAVLDALPAPATIVPTPTNRPNVAMTAPSDTNAVKPSAAELSLAQAQAAVDHGDDDRARILYEAILNGPPLSHEQSLRLADGLYALRHFKAAVTAFQRAGKLDRSLRRYHYAVALFEAGHLQEARVELAAALPFLEETPDVTLYRAKIEAGKTEAAK